MHRWLSGVPALLHNWYPGQEGGRALADILTGQHSPEGHLPVSFERSWEENPVHDNYYAPPVPKGQTPHVAYKEGVFVGYRYYTSFDKKPLFPFGFGLSYTTFSFSNLKVSPEQASADGSITVSFDVTNTGQRERRHRRPGLRWAILRQRSSAPRKNSRDSKRFASVQGTPTTSASPSIAGPWRIGAPMKMVGRSIPANSLSSSAIRRKTRR
jgi:hypothetical protein